MGIQINGATDSITAIDGTIDVVSAIGNAGVVTATAFVGNITGNVTGNINHASTLELQTGGVTRAHFNSSGHFAIAGITTMSGNLTIENAEPSIFFTDTNGNPDYKIFNDAGALKIYDTTYSATRLQIGPTNGEVTIASNTNFPNGITMNPGTASVVNTIAQRLGNTTAKIRFPANDTFTVETTGSERLRITSTGAVGINTATPIGDFTVFTADNGYFGIDGGGGYGAEFNVYHRNTKALTYKFANNGGTNELAQHSLISNSGKFIWHIGGTTNEKMRLTTTGLGIGTDNPGSPLHIESHSAGLSVRRNGQYLLFDANFGNGGDQSISSSAGFRVQTGGVGNSYERFRILSNGNIGIGEVSPSSDVKFTVRKDIAAASGNSTIQIRNLYQGTANASNQSGGEIEFLFKNHNASHNWWGGRILCYNSDNYNQYTHLQFHTASQGNAVERMRLDHDGDLTLYGKTNAELKLKCGTSSSNDIIAFINSVGTTRGNITYDTDDNFLLFNVNLNERLRIDNSGNLKQGTSTPVAFTNSSPSQVRFLGKKCMQGSVTDTVTLDSNGNGTFDLGKLWLTDDTSIELFIQVMRNDSTNNQTHYCKAFIQKVKGQGMRQGEITHQNGEAYSSGSGFRVTSITSGGYTGSGGAAHGTQISVAGGAGGVIYRAVAFWTALSKNDMY